MARYPLFAAALFASLTVCLLLAVAARAAEPEQPEAVETITEAENVQREVEQAPGDTQRLPAVDRAQQTTERQTSRRPHEGDPAAPPEADRPRIDPHFLGLRFEQDDQGLKVARCPRGCAAALVGLRAGDEIVSVGEQPVNNREQLSRALEKSLREFSQDEHVEVPMIVRRGDSEHTVNWTNRALTVAGYGPLLTEFGHYVPPTAVTGYRGENRDPSIPANPRGGYLGVVLDSRYPGSSIVSRIVSGSAAEQAGLQPGDRIYSVNMQPVESSRELIYWLSQMQPGEVVELGFDRAHNLNVTLGERPARSRQSTTADPSESVDSDATAAPELGKP